jgi:hypothetical protein
MNCEQLFNTPLWTKFNLLYTVYNLNYATNFGGKNLMRNYIWGYEIKKGSSDVVVYAKFGE